MSIVIEGAIYTLILYTLSSRGHAVLQTVYIRARGVQTFGALLDLIMREF